MIGQLGATLVQAVTVCLPGGAVGTGVAAARENGREVVSEACK